MAHRGRARGEMGGSNKTCTGSLRNLTTGLIWLERGWGDRGRRGEVAHGGRARGEMRGGRCKKSGLIWLGMGEAWGGGPWRAGKGGDGGGTREQCGSNKRCTVPLFLGSLKNLITGAGAKAWGGGPGRRWGHQKARDGGWGGGGG